MSNAGHSEIASLTDAIGSGAGTSDWLAPAPSIGSSLIFTASGKVLVLVHEKPTERASASGLFRALAPRGQHTRTRKSLWTVQPFPEREPASAMPAGACSASDLLKMPRAVVSLAPVGRLVLLRSVEPVVHAVEPAVRTARGVLLHLNSQMAHAAFAK